MSDEIYVRDGVTIAQMSSNALLTHPVVVAVFREPEPITTGERP